MHFGQTTGSLLRSKNFVSQLVQRRFVPSSDLVTSYILMRDGREENTYSGWGTTSKSPQGLVIIGPHSFLTAFSSEDIDLK